MTFFYFPLSSGINSQDKIWLRARVQKAALVTLQKKSKDSWAEAKKGYKSASFCFPNSKRMNILPFSSLLSRFVLFPQVLQKLGKTEESRDEQFERCLRQFNDQQVITPLLNEKIRSTQLLFVFTLDSGKDVNVWAIEL